MRDIDDDLCSSGFLTLISRPRTIDEVAHQAEVVQTLKASLQSGNVSCSSRLIFFSLSSQLPHLLFYGPPGTGKTSTILAIARDLFGSVSFFFVDQEFPAFFFSSFLLSFVLASSRTRFSSFRSHEYFRSRVQELNASDERGINVIREKVKTFAQAAASEIPLKCASHFVPQLIAHDRSQGAGTQSRPTS